MVSKLMGLGLFMRSHHLIPPDASFLFVICFPDYNGDDYNDDRDDVGDANHHYLVKRRKRGRTDAFTALLLLPEI